MICFPCDTFQSLGKEKGGALREWGWGWEDGLAVNLHSVILSTRKQAEGWGKAEERYDCVPKVSQWLMASSKVLCGSCS